MSLVFILQPQQVTISVFG
uniref:Uncharacterized protein n=1 Tax=Anguilla anguilla TaxID=7936 RepID=A0A0E9W649_ANGAN